MSRKRWGDGPTPLSDSEDESEDLQKADLGMITGEGQDLQKARTDLPLNRGFRPVATPGWSGGID